MVLSGEENITTKEIHTVGNASSEATNSGKFTEKSLVDGLSNDVVLGQIVPRLSRNLQWDKRPVLNLLSRSWDNAMTGDYPLRYDRLYNPDAILSSGGFIVFRNEDIGLWVWNPFIGLTTMLPPPPLSFTSWDKEMFVCDGDWLYVLLAGTDTEEQDVQRDVYHVWMLNFRDFNVTWKKLPSLPMLNAELVGSDVDATNYLGERYICQRSDGFSWEADGIWKLSERGENNSEWYWQYITANTPPPKNLNFDTSDSLPSYIEIIELFNDMVTVSTRSLYARLSISYQTAFYIFQGISRSALRILLIPSGDRSGGSKSRAAIHDHLYYIAMIPEVMDGIDVRKLDFYNERTRTVEVGELEDWHNELQHHKPRSATAIKLFRGRNPCKIVHRLNLEWKNETPGTTLGSITVAHCGPIYAYELKFEKRI